MQGNIKEFKDKSGYKLFVKENHHIPIVSVRFSFLGGLLAEDEKNNGIYNFITGMLHRGTKNRNMWTLAKDMEGIGGSFRASSGKNSLVISLDILSRYFEKGIQILSDVILNPKFEPAEIKKERESILEDIKSEKDILATHCFNTFSKNLYKKHPYSMNILGTQKTINKISRENLIFNYEKICTSKNLVVSVVGEIKTAKVLKIIKKYFKDLATHPTKIKNREKINFPKKSKIIKENSDKMQAHIIVGWPGATLSSHDKYVLELISAILSGQSGRLFINLRDKKGLAYSVSSFSIEGVDPGFFAIYIGTSPVNINIALNLIKKEILDLHKGEIHEHELARAKEYIIGNYELELQQNGTQATIIAFNELYKLGKNEYFDYPKKIANIQMPEIRRAINKFLDPKRAIVSVLAPKGGEKVKF